MNEQDQSRRLDIPNRDTERAAHKTRRKLLLFAALIVVSHVAANAAQNTARYNDGEFIGKSADTIWGEAQVKAVIYDGTIRDVRRTGRNQPERWNTDFSVPL